MFAAKEATKRDSLAGPVKAGASFKGSENGNHVYRHIPGPMHLRQRYLGNSYLQSKSQATIQRQACDGSCDGTCPSCKQRKELTEQVQMKLTVGPADDVYEQEADRVAKQVMRMPDLKATEGLTSSGALRIRRLPAGGGGQQVPTDFQISQSGGRSLSKATRQFMEPRFRVDFGSVRLHTGPQAQQQATQLQAHAFTYGNHIWLGKGASENSKSLMAHELTHVMQQSGTIQRLPFGIGLPSGARGLDPVEERIGRGVYGSSLTYGDIYVSDALGAGGRPFTLYVPFVGTIIQIGPGPYRTPGSSPRLLIHEMAHSWQSQHHSNLAKYMENSIRSQAEAARAGGGASAYCYVPGRPFGDYAAEQIAEQAENGVAAIRGHMRSVTAGSVDPDNVTSLSTPRYEVRGAPGVRC